MQERGYSEAFARQIFEQIKGFGEYGFPESHAASFALLVYVSAWIKCHEPAAFACALLNSQPMGFYAPAQLVGDARRHGVAVRGVDASRSQWDCTLEGEPGTPAMRLGLRMIKGFPKASADRLVAAREERPFQDPADIARRAELTERDMALLASAGALERLSGHRYRAHWDVLGIDALPPLLEGSVFNEAIPMLPVPTRGENLVADYAALGLTLGEHPLRLLRERLSMMRFIDAEGVNGLRHGDFVRTVGLVINRQRPSTAKGVIFMTLEDETGFINLVLWPWVVERERLVTMRARLLGVTGVVEREGGVIHVVAARLEDHTRLLGRLQTRSRDFH
jgi:error-prone DNA polymerase